MDIDTKTALELKSRTQRPKRFALQDSTQLLTFMLCYNFIIFDQVRKSELFVYDLLS